jgi:hypothetical protein
VQSHERRQQEAVRRVLVRGLLDVLIMPGVPAVSWEPPGDLDPEVLELCRAMNSLQGITTYSSCCGHGERDVTVGFLWDAPEDLAFLLYCVSPCHGGSWNWRVTAHSDCGKGGPWYTLEGPPGDYAGCLQVASSIREYLK